MTRTGDGLERQRGKGKLIKLKNYVQNLLKDFLWGGGTVCFSWLDYTYFRVIAEIILIVTWIKHKHLCESHWISKTPSGGTITTDQCLTYIPDAVHSERNDTPIAIGYTEMPEIYGFEVERTRGREDRQERRKVNTMDNFSHESDVTSLQDLSTSCA